MSQVRNLACWPLTQPPCLCPSQQVPYSLSQPLVRFYTLWGDMERMNHAAPCQKCSEGCRHRMVSMGPANSCSDTFIYLCCVIFSCPPSLWVLPLCGSSPKCGPSGEVLFCRWWKESRDYYRKVQLGLGLWLEMCTLSDTHQGHHCYLGYTLPIFTFHEWRGNQKAAKCKINVYRREAFQNQAIHKMFLLDPPNNTGRGSTSSVLLTL